MSQNRERRPTGQDGAPLEISHQATGSDQDHPNRFRRRHPDWAAAGLLYPPAGRRSRWGVVVTHCPLCHYMHRHALDGFARVIVGTPSCRPWLSYEIHAAVVLPQPDEVAA
jgi:hypothetical protein